MIDDCSRRALLEAWMPGLRNLPTYKSACPLRDLVASELNQTRAPGRSHHTLPQPNGRGI